MPPGSPSTNDPIRAPAASAPAGTAASRPPEVIASMTSARRSGRTDGEKSANLSASAALRALPPERASPAAASSSAPGEGGHGRRVDLRRHPACVAELVQVAEQAEAGHVGQRMRLRLAGGRAPPRR